MYKTANITKALPIKLAKGGIGGVVKLSPPFLFKNLEEYEEDT